MKRSLRSFHLSRAMWSKGRDNRHCIICHFFMLPEWLEGRTARKEPTFRTHRGQALASARLCLHLVLKKYSISRGRPVLCSRMPGRPRSDRATEHIRRRPPAPADSALKGPRRIRARIGPENHEDRRRQPCGWRCDHRPLRRVHGRSNPEMFETRDHENIALQCPHDILQ